MGFDLSHLGLHDPYCGYEISEFLVQVANLQSHLFVESTYLNSKPSVHFVDFAPNAIKPRIRDFVVAQDNIRLRLLGGTTNGLTGNKTQPQSGAEGKSEAEVVAMESAEGTQCDVR